MVRERQALVGQLQSLFRDLGLERRPAAVPDVAAYLVGKATPSDETVPQPVRPLRR